MIQEIRLVQDFVKEPIDQIWKTQDYLDDGFIIQEEL